VKPTVGASPLTSIPSSEKVREPGNHEVAGKPPVPSFPSLTFGRWVCWVGLFLLISVVALLGCLRYGTQVIEFSRILTILISEVDQRA